MDTAQKFSNELSDAQAERLAILLEELGEAQQAIGKILRHGFYSANPLLPQVMLNIHDLEKELGDVIFAIKFLCSSSDLNWQQIERRCWEKREKIKPYLHHQEV